MEVLDSIRWMTWLKIPMKSVASCDKLRRGACSLWTGDYWIGHPSRSEEIGNAVNWSVLVTAGKEINRDAVSISEKKQHRANRIPCRNEREMWCFRLTFNLRWISWTLLECRALEDDSSVDWIQKGVWVSWVPLIGNCAGIWETSTSNSKYVLRPIVYAVQWWKAEKYP